VIFDESVFPFAALHPNAGARYTFDFLLTSPRNNEDANLTNAHTMTMLPVEFPVQVLQNAPPPRMEIPYQVPGPVAAEAPISGDPASATGDRCPAPDAAPSLAPLNDCHIPMSSSVLPSARGSTPAPQPSTPALRGVSVWDMHPTSLSMPTTSAAPVSDSSLPPVVDSTPGHTVLPAEPMTQLSLNPVPRSSTVGVLVPAPAPPHTRLHDGITKPKIYTDGMVHYVYTIASAEPYTVKEALPSPDWKVTMLDEYNALMSNKTWTLFPPVPGRNVIDAIGSSSSSARSMVLWIVTKLD
jgi:hypothetical protein